MLTTLEGETVLQPAPELYEVYRASEGSPECEWIAEGTDSKLYTVPADPGGWMLRCEYHGQTECLKALSQKEARFVCWKVYGDVGRVTMEGANLVPR